MLNNNEFFYYDENNEQDYSTEIFAQNLEYEQPDGIGFEQDSFRGRGGKWGHDCKPSHRPCPPCPKPCPPCPKPCPPQHCCPPCCPCPCQCQCRNNNFSSGDDWWIIILLFFFCCPFGGWFW